MQGTIDKFEEKRFEKGSKAEYLRVHFEEDGKWHSIVDSKENKIVATVKEWLRAGVSVEYEVEGKSGYENITAIRLLSTPSSSGTSQGSGSCPPPDQVPPAHNGNGRESDEVKAQRIGRMNAITIAGNALAARGFTMDVSTTDENGVTIIKPVRIPDNQLARCIIALAKKLYHYTITGDVQE